MTPYTSSILLRFLTSFFLISSFLLTRSARVNGQPLPKFRAGVLGKHGGCGWFGYVIMKGRSEWSCAPPINIY
jgi:hypothetical protein